MGNGLGEELSFYVEATTWFGAHVPFDEKTVFASYFNASNAIQMHTASGVGVGAFFAGEHRSVCVPGDERPVMVVCPRGQTFLCSLFGFMVFGGTGGI